MHSLLESHTYAQISDKAIFVAFISILFNFWVLDVELLLLT